MTLFEIYSTVIAIIGLLILILKVWTKTQTDIAEIKIQMNAFNEKQKECEVVLKEHKIEDNNRYEQMRKENREDHRLLFEKIDKIIPFIKNN